MNASYAVLEVVTFSGLFIPVLDMPMKEDIKRIKPDIPEDLLKKAESMKMTQKQREIWRLYASRSFKSLPLVTLTKFHSPHFSASSRIGISRSSPVSMFRAKQIIRFGLCRSNSSMRRMMDLSNLITPYFRFNDSSSPSRAIVMAPIRA